MFEKNKYLLFLLFICILSILPFGVHCQGSQLFSDSLTIIKTSGLGGGKLIAPDNLRVRVVSPEQSLLMWDDNERSEEGYSIERKGESGGFEEIGTVGKNFETFIDRDLEWDSKYVYRVRAFKSDSFSDYSNESEIRITLVMTESEDGIDEFEKKSVMVSLDEEEMKEVVAGGVAEEFFEENQDASRAVAVVGSATSAAIAMASGGIPFLSLIPNSFQSSIFTFLMFPFYRRKTKDDWGIIFDDYTKEGVKGVLVELVDDEDGSVVDRVITDNQGRYGFLVAKDGRYRIKIDKGQYEIKKGKEHDSVYERMYDGGVFESKKSSVVKFNISLDPKGFDWNAFSAEVIRKYKSFSSLFRRYIFILLALLGFIFASGVLYFNPNLINYLIFSLHLIIVFWHVILKAKRPFGFIKSSDTSKPIPFAMIALHDPQTKQREAFVISNVLGGYYLLTENGEYSLRISGRKEGVGYVSKEDEVKIDKGILKRNYEL